MRVTIVQQQIGPRPYACQNQTNFELLCFACNFDARLRVRACPRSCMGEGKVLLVFGFKNTFISDQSTV